MRYAISLLYLFLSFSPIRGQSQEIKLKGFVQDSLSNPIGLVQVIVRSNEGGQILSFASSNQQGYYQMQFTTEQDSIHLNARRIGFEVFQKLIPLNELTSDSKPFTIILNEKASLLDEVVIEGNRPIRQNGDTLTYQVEAFTDGTEEVAEDVLKKIPGVDVSDDGTIQYQGKEIKKILLDGDDLADSRYKVLSKNLSAELLSEVEILMNYTDNRLFKGIEQTKDVAINLKIKEGKKAPLFGDIEAGGGPPDAYSANTNVLSYTNNIKALLTGDINNIGSDAVGADIQRFSMGNLEYRQFQFTQPLVQTRLARPGFISNKYLRFHDSKYATLNLISKPTDRLTIRAMSSLYSNRINYETRQSIQYYTLATPFELAQSQRQTIEPLEVFTDLKMTYQIGANSDLEVRTHYTRDQSQLNTQNILNDELLPDSLNNDSHIALVEAQLTNRISSKLAVKTQLSYTEDELNQNYQLLNPSLELGDELHQRIQQKNQNIGLTSTVKANLKGFAMDGTIGWVSVDRELYSALSSTNQSNLSVNDLRYQANSLFTEVLVKREQRRFEFTAGGRIRHEDFRLVQNRDRRTFFEPTFGIKTKLGKFYKAGLVYSKQFGLSQLPVLYSNSILVNYRTSLSNDIDFRKALSNESLVFHLNFNDAEKSFVTAYVKALYVRSSPFASFSNVIQSNGILMNQRSLFGESMTYSITTGFDKYIPSLSSTIKLSYLADWIDIPNMVNDEVQNTRISNQGLKASMGSAFDGIFNFGISVNGNRTTSQTELGSQSFYFGRFNQKITLQPGRKFYAVFEAEQLAYFSEDGNTKSLTPLGSIRMDYTLKPNKTSIGLIIQNVFNRRTAEIQSVDQLSSSTNTYFLLPRFMLLKFKYRF